MEYLSRGRGQHNRTIASFLLVELLQTLVVDSLESADVETSSSLPKMCTSQSPRALKTPDMPKTRAGFC